MGLRSAFIISGIIHTAIAAPLYTHSLIRSDFVRKDPVIVDYMILSQISNITIANTSNKEDVAVREAPKPEIQKSSAPRTVQAKHDKSYYKRKTDRAVKKDDLKNIKAADRKESEIKSSKDYISYYGYLKDRIRARLQDNYRYYNGEGDVYLSFVLNDRGALLTYSIDRARSTKDNVLLHITSTSLMAVAPFSALPKAISAPKMSFNITIAFKK
ncbi:MAG: hypothetical protein Q8R38_08005 [Candidatus Omnitrophota bacterium]|nr:hypothetical protein [Candidatus Omnitrophota bacterium]